MLTKNSALQENFGKNRPKKFRPVLAKNGPQIILCSLEQERIFEWRGGEEDA